MAKGKSKAAEARLDGFFNALETDLLSLGEIELNAATRFALDRLRARMKKRALYCNPELEPTALRDFVNLNASLADKRVNVDPRILAESRRFIEHILETYATRVNDQNIQITLDYEHLYDLWRFSPGATQHAEKLPAGHGNHAVEKIDAIFTTTWRAVPWVYKLRRTNHYFHQQDTLAGKVAMSAVLGSQMLTVPKNQEKVRTIAKEPLGNMIMQLAAGQYLTNVLAMIGLDITSQQVINKRLACFGSVTGEVATLDMTSASDMILTELVRALFPAEWVELLTAIRSEYTDIPGHGTVKLNMISTMGNGFTFPMMTLIIVSLIYGCRAVKPGKQRPFWVDWSRTAVYGDDIICPTDEVAVLITTLTDAGFIINKDKSYVEGPFRESCGGDYYKGVNVTPFYVTKLNVNADIYVAINKVLEFCANHKVVLCEALQYLRSILRGPAFLVAEWDAPDSGVQTCDVPRRYKKLQVKRLTRKVENQAYLLPLAVGGFVESSDLITSKPQSWIWGVGESLLSMFWKFVTSKPQQQDGVATVVYCPQPYQNEYSVKSCRLPKGYLSGWDPNKRSREVSSFISAYVELIFG